MLPHDHPEIAADDKAIRRISREYHLSRNDDGTLRVSTMAFEPSTDAHRGMSIDLERQIVEAGLEPKQFVSSPQFVGSVWFTAGALRAESFQVGFDPLPENAHHGAVWGKFTKGKKKTLLRLAAWYVGIDGVSL